MARPRGQNRRSPGALLSRLADPKNKRRPRREWSRQELKLLASLAKKKVPVREISIEIGRPKTAIVSKARREGIVLPRAVSRYRRKQ
jgi:hypothetical protein